MKILTLSSLLLLVWGQDGLINVTFIHTLQLKMASEEQGPAIVESLSQSFADGLSVQESSAGRARGVVAQRRFSRGERVLREAPTLRGLVNLIGFSFCKSSVFFQRVNLHKA